jgi:hypothetical protein
MGMQSWNCQVCGRDMMSDPKKTYCYDKTPAWMRDVVVFMPCDLKLEGEYTGYSAVKTGETKISPYVYKRWLDRDNDLEGVSPIYMGATFDGEAADADRGYLSLHQWKDHYLWNPCCYHRACWEAVGSPEGYRGPSLVSQDQGFGGNATIGRTNGFTDYEDGDTPCAPPQPGPEAIQLWAVNSVIHFLYMVNSWAVYQDAAEEHREMWRRMAELDELLRDEGIERKKS